jgi:hypothetical protein
MDFQNLFAPGNAVAAKSSCVLKTPFFTVAPMLVCAAIYVTSAAG